MRVRRLISLIAFCALATVLFGRGSAGDVRLKKAVRKPERAGWIYVHLEGSPAEIGFQHGYLLAAEIATAQKILQLSLTHDSGRDYAFFRDAARQVLWPRIEEEYRTEMGGILEGLRARDVPLDLWDVVVMNANLELPYFSNWKKSQEKTSTAARYMPIAERCSAFAATGSYTRDGRVVMGHNAWTGYADGARWNIIFHIVPAKGHRILMDGFPGLIHSGDDFGMNSAGIMITETTISQFSGFDPVGIPEFARARKAMQYSESIDGFARIMKDGNNGGYANHWLVADTKRNEIASLELGLRNAPLRRTRDGYFSGANFPVDEKLMQEETAWDPKDMGLSGAARRVRWDELMAGHKGKIDIAAGKRFLSDHWDTFDKVRRPSERTICGHIDLSPRGVKDWWGPFGPAGAVQNKLADSEMAGKMSLLAFMGHACGMDFKASKHLAAHPEFGWLKPHLIDLNARGWMLFAATR
jgi:hypothetical protein